MTGDQVASGLAFLLSAGGAVIMGAIVYVVRIHTRVNYLAKELERIDDSSQETRRLLHEIREKVIRIDASLNGKH